MYGNFMISFFKYIGLACVVALFASSTVVLAMNGDEEEHSPHPHSPVAGPSTPSAASSSTEAVEQTPGQKIAQQQARFLTRKNFEEVFGPDEVAQWDISLDVFSRDTSVPDSAEKRDILRRLAQILRKQQNHSEEAKLLYWQVTGLQADIKGVHSDRLEEVIKTFLKEHYPQATHIQFQTKTGGDQMGSIAIIELGEGERLKFYIKTHSEGRKASLSSAAKIFDPNELFVYKVLEALGLGCETHFCARSPEDVYIVTRDAAEGGHFFLFQQATKEEEGVGNSLWGGLGRLSNSPRENKNNEETIEKGLAYDPAAQNFAHQLVTADVLARLLGLHDLLNNPDNFGFFQSADSEFPALRVLDFRLDVNSVEFIDPIFYGLLSGNGTFHYAAAHKTLGWLLHERTRAKRVATALHILTSGSLQTLEEAVENAYQSVCDFIQETPAFEAYRDKFIQDLTDYRNSLQQNRRRLIDLLSAWKPEEPSAASASSVSAAVDAGGAL